MRCPACGASNPERAQWCGQCYERLGDTSPPAPEAAPAPDASTAVPLVTPGADGLPLPPGAAPGPQPGSPAADPAALARRGLRKRGDELEWECVTCGEFNPMERMECTVCSTPFTARFSPPAKEEPERDWSTALLLSAVLPGGGHIAVGRHGSGIARALLYAVWLGGGLVLGLGAGAIAVAAPLLLGALVLWGGSMVDLLRLREGQDEVLAGRVLLWLVVGVTVLLLLGAVAGTLGGGAR